MSRDFIVLYSTHAASINEKYNQQIWMVIVLLKNPYHLIIKFIIEARIVGDDID